MIKTTTTRYDDGDLKSVIMQITSRIPGNRRVVAIDHQNNGGWLIQTNFNDFYEQRTRLDVALGVAMAMLVEIA